MPDSQTASPRAAIPAFSDSAVFDAHVENKVLWYLIGRTGPTQPSRRLAIQNGMVIGRRPESNLCISHPTVSGRHALLICEGESLFIQDLSSTNGTTVNSLRIQKHELSHGDVVQFGSAVFRIELERQSSVGMTLSSDSDDHGLAHLLFDKLLSDPAVNPHYQPIVRLADQRVIGHEVLARSGLFGLENPASMFAIAEERNQEIDLSRLMRREGVRIGLEYGVNGQFYLNTHPTEIADPGLPDALIELRQSFPAAQIVLEIHEAALTTTRQLGPIRDLCRRLNFQIAYDDFGAGQARLLELTEVPPDVIKFDMHLIRGIAQASRERRRLLRGLVRIVDQLDITPLAEGIETSDEAEVCLDLGFALAQGYYFGRPSPVRPSK